MHKSDAQDVVANLIDAGKPGAIMFNSDPEVMMWTETPMIGNVRFGNETNHAILDFDTAVKVVQGISWFSARWPKEEM